MQANAVHGFCAWFASLPPHSDGIHREFNDQLLHVLTIYESELDRQIAGDPASQDWFQLVALDAQLAELLKEELLELYPELTAYDTNDEPQTIHQMIARLLSDAVTRFEASQTEMAAYLEKPVLPGVLDDLLRRIQGTQEAA
jgi:hypothetical protein